MCAMNTDTAGFLDSRDFARIARAIGFIDTHFRAQPRLAAIAAATHLSEFHFNRLFRRWAGITPRQYLAFVTARAARAALGTASVLTAAHTVGLSGPGRLHDLIVSLEAVTPGELKAGGASVMLTAGFADTPFGRALIASTPRGVAHLEFLEPGREAAALAALKAAWPRARLGGDDAAAQRLAAQIFGTPPAAARELRLAVRGTNFQLKVWQALLASGPGATLSYAGLARAAGSGAGARAVGNALAANPVAWLIPCHNVLRRDGTLGGYRYGTERKRAMLAWSALRCEPAPQSVRAGQRA
jgi:AraC family transcriptional regulator, regulatory protein of adaptative response / methylated-DNA-[protein]-cysteine methyltransferase